MATDYKALGKRIGRTYHSPLPIGLLYIECHPKTIFILPERL